jgi:hypothetical protein
MVSCLPHCTIHRVLECCTHLRAFFEHPSHTCCFGSVKIPFILWTQPTHEKRNEDDKDNTYCQWCHDCPCVWSSNRNGMIEWDEKEHIHLASDDLPSKSTRRKYLYQQMALTISDGPPGKRNRIVLPDCVKDGIPSLLPEDKEGKYMGHKDE